MTKKILIINGPNLNLLGEREESKYGSKTLEEVKKNCESHAKSINVEIKFDQSNIEGEIVTMIQKAKGSFDGIIINAAGYTHTSVSILDALKVLKIPIIESGEKKPINPYAETKVKKEELAVKYSKMGVKVIGLRYFNVFGKGQSKEYAGVLKLFLERVRDKLPPKINGDGTQFRDFVYVEDVANANITRHAYEHMNII